MAAVVVIALVGVAVAVELPSLSGTHPAASRAAGHPGATLAASPPASSSVASPSAPVPAASAPASAPALVASGVTATSSFTPTTGAQVFADDFTDPGSGWLSGAYGTGTYAYTPHGYTVTGTGDIFRLAYAPFDSPEQQLTTSITARQSTGEPGAGFGVSCRRSFDSASQLRYEFLVTASGRWSVQRNVGTLSLASTPTTLQSGTSPRRPGVAPVTVTGTCASLSGQQTRLVLFVDGAKVADFVDASPVDGTGWLGAIMTASDVGPAATTTVSAFNEYVLAAPAAVIGLGT
jgi:hypothetical protein